MRRLCWKGNCFVQTDACALVGTLWATEKNISACIATFVQLGNYMYTAIYVQLGTYSDRSVVYS